MIKIVILEPQELLREEYTSLLNTQGYEVYSATDGKKGLALIRSILPSLVLSEVLLPTLDGFRILSHMSAHALTKDIPVLLVTELGHPDDMMHGIHLGAHEFLMKGHHTPEQVVKKINTLLKETKKKAT